MASLNQDCPICKSGIDTDSKVITPCKHAFCSDCFFQWIKNGKTCPLCRKILVSDPIDEAATVLEDINSQINAANDQLDADYHVLERIRAEANSLRDEIRRSKATIVVYDRLSEKLQKTVEYKRDWLALYNTKINNHIQQTQLRQARHQRRRQLHY